MPNLLQVKTEIKYLTNKTGIFSKEQHFSFKTLHFLLLKKSKSEGADEDQLNF